MHETNADWLEGFPRDDAITALLLPGTHDTMTASCGARYYRTQTLSLSEQLSAGVRFLDIRLRRDMRAAHREWVSTIDADAIFGTCASFLQEHGTEFLLMRIQNANEKKDDYEAYGAALHEKIANWSDLFYHREEGSFAWPTLGACAGKVVALECAPPKYGFSRMAGRTWAENWHGNPRISLQDLWDGPTEAEKQDAIRAQMEQSARLPQDVLSLSHISATNGELGFPDAFARRMNPYSLALLKEMPAARGALIYDFITPAICEAVIARNGKR